MTRRVRSAFIPGLILPHHNFTALRKRTIEVVVLSDIYLGSEECKAQELLIYLSSIKPGTLILNGGLIAGNANNLKELPKVHMKVVKKIVALAAQGTAVYVLAGETDHYLKRLEGIAVGSIQIRKELVLDLDNQKTWFLHGQHFDMGRTSFSLLRPFRLHSYTLLARCQELSNSLVRFFIKRKAGELPVKNPSFCPEQFRTNALHCAAARGFGAVVCGYTGRADKYVQEMEYGSTQYLNSGGWLGEMTALEYAFKRWKIYRYQADKCSVFFADEEFKSMDLTNIKTLLDTHGKRKKHKNRKKSLH